VKGSILSAVVIEAHFVTLVRSEFALLIASAKSSRLSR
jgi:hypothetical protein